MSPTFLKKKKKIIRAVSNGGICNPFTQEKLEWLFPPSFLFQKGGAGRLYLLQNSFCGFRVDGRPLRQEGLCHEFVAEFVGMARIFAVCLLQPGQQGGLFSRP